MKNLPLFLLMLILAACSGEAEISIPEEIASLENLSVFSSTDVPTHTISLNKLVGFGDTDDVMIGRISSFTVDHRGRVFIGDFSEHKVHVYSPEGNYLQSIGREGSGPGEFRNIGLIRTGNGYLHVQDRNQRRISLYDLETLRHVRDISLSTEHNDDSGSGNRYPSTFYLQPDGNYLIQFGVFYRPSSDSDEEQTMNISLFNTTEEKYAEHDLFSFQPSEALIDQTENSIMIMSMPYKRSTNIQFQNNLLVHGWSDQMLFRFYDEKGVYRHSFYYPFEKAALNRSEILKEYEEFGERQRKMVRNDQMPDNWPAFNSLQMDDENRLWISAITDDSETYLWWVLHEDGSKLAEFSWPRERSIQQIKNGNVYTREEDEMGLTQIVKYSVELN